MGSEFAYEDMAEKELNKFTYKWVGDQGCCNVVERYPKDEDLGYSMQKVWFDKSNRTVAKIDFYNLGNTLAKTMTATNYQEYNGRFWRPARMIMVNHLTGKQTTLEWSNFRFSLGLNADKFTTRALERVR